MCRSIHRLYNIDPPVTSDEVQGAALQYVRKISGAAKPPKRTQRHSREPSRTLPTSRGGCWVSWWSSAPPRDRALDLARPR